jgi:ATP phosphoribosyltransferase regulatory subunit
VLVEAVALLAGTGAEAPAKRLLALYDAATRRGLAHVLSADPGEVRGFAYYTGPIFSIYAEGPGEAIGGGGRYDELLARFGAPMPAAGLGIDLDALAWARRAAGHAPASADGVVVVGAPDDPRVAELRARGVTAVAIADAAAARAYAASWSFAYVWEDATIPADEVVAVLEHAVRSNP